MCKFVISYNEILNNLKNAKSKLRKNVKICGVVKANAYGFGLNSICSLIKNSVDYFAVARLSEFLQFKKLEIDKPCLILSPLFEKELAIAVSCGAEIIVDENTNLFFIQSIAKSCGTVAKIHIKLDTGMNRFGIKEKEDLINILTIVKKLKNIEIIGCFSHLYNAGNKKDVRTQRNKFFEFKNLILSFGINPIFHFSNSEGLNDEFNQFDMVRLGLDLYLGENSLHKLVCKVLAVKNVKKGETVSYGATYKAKKNMKIAVIEGGYADGIPRSLSNKGKVLIAGKFCDIIGTVCMDCFMVDVSNLAVKRGQEVVVFGKSGESIISVCSFAKKCGTIPYEIFTNLSSRVKRIFKWRNYADYHRKIQGKKTPIFR